MTAQPSPPRLIHDVELGDVMRKAREREWPASRLAKNGEAVLKATSASATSTVLGTPVGKTAALTKVGIVLALSGGVAMTLWFEGALKQTEQGMPPPRREEGIAPASNAQPVERPATALRRPARSERTARGERPAGPESTLPDQLAMFDAARAAAKAGEHGRALELLGNLRRAYPETPLSPDIELAEVESLAANGQIDDALAAIDILLQAPMLAGKKGRLLLLQGDLLQQKGNCPHAVLAYRRALGVGLTDAEVDAARAGLKRCVAR